MRKSHKCWLVKGIGNGYARTRKILAYSARNQAIEKTFIWQGIERKKKGELRKRKRMGIGIRICNIICRRLHFRHAISQASSGLGLIVHLITWPRFGTERKKEREVSDWDEEKERESEFETGQTTVGHAVTYITVIALLLNALSMDKSRLASETQNWEKYTEEKREVGIKSTPCGVKSVGVDGLSEFVRS